MFGQECLLIGGFFEDNITFWKLHIPKRLLIPFLVVVAAKVTFAILIFYWMDVGSAGTFWFDPDQVLSKDQNIVFLQVANGAGRWPYLFAGWDSAWYLSIMTEGYGFSPQSHAFSPGLPFMGSLLNLALNDPLVSIVVPGLVFGVLWVPFYHLLAEGYMGKRAAFASTLLFALWPYTFLFTTVAYGEGLLLFFSISAYYLLKQGKVGWASGLAAVTALTRITGILICLPILINALKQKSSRKLRNITLSLLPVAVLALWFAYFQILVGDFFAPIHTTEWSDLHTVPSLLFQELPQGLQSLSELTATGWPTTHHWLLPATIVCALFIPPFLISKILKIDKPLAIYTLAVYIGVLCFGALVSMPRFISILFPLWLPLTAKVTWNKKAFVVLGAFLAVLLLVNLDMWMNFLDGKFVA